jgi:prophage tail gpP-like protein
MSTQEQIVVSIDQQRWNFWEQIEIQRSIDNFSTVSFTSDFEPDQQLFRDTFRPFTYKDLDVVVDNDPLFRGQLLEVSPSEDPSVRQVECAGYSLPAQLADSTPPESEFPIEFNNVTLRQIATRLAEPFGIPITVEGSDGTAFRRVKIKPDQTIYDFLVKLAKQRSLIITDTPIGQLRFYQSIDTGVPVVKLREGEQPLQRVAATFNPQTYYSEITGFARTKAASRGSRYTVTNPKLTNATRTLSFIADDVKAPDLPTAVQAKMGRMFGNMVSYVIEVPTWRDPSGALWEPNTLISLEAPGAMIYNETTFLVRDVILSQDAQQTGARIGLVLPGAFSGKIPRVFPWD